MKYMHILNEWITLWVFTGKGIPNHSLWVQIPLPAPCWVS